MWSLESWFIFSFLLGWSKNNCYWNWHPLTPETTLQYCKYIVPCAWLLIRNTFISHINSSKLWVFKKSFTIPLLLDKVTWDVWDANTHLHGPWACDWRWTVWKVRAVSTQSSHAMILRLMLTNLILYALTLKLYFLMHLRFLI